MTDAEKAYQIAEQRIARAKAKGLAYLCLAETPDTSDPVKWDTEEALTHLATIPPSISSLTEVKRLDLDRTQVADLSPLAGMAAMQTLTLSSTQVTDLSPVAVMVEMQTLYLDDTQVTDLSPLAGMVAMQALNLDRTQVTDLSPLAGMVEMQELNLSITQVTDLSPLAGMVEMQTLNLNSTQVTDLPPLAGMVEMQTLNLNSTQVTDLSPLARMVEMQTLYLDSTQVTDLSPLAEMVAMQTLDLSNTQVTDLSPLAGMGAMQGLNLYGTHVADLSPLTGMVAMQALDLSSTQVTDLSPLAGMVAMQTLWLNNTQVTDLSPLAGMEKLIWLYLQSTKADLLGLVNAGSAWAAENRDLDIRFKGMNFDDPTLQDIADRSGADLVGAEALGRLRELRDMAPPPAAPQDREDGAKLDLDDHGALTLSDPALGDADQDDLSEELQDACAALSASLATSNQFAHTRGRSDRLMRLLTDPPSDAGAERAWALVNALRDDHEGHQAAAKANDLGEIGAAEAMLPPVAAPKLATVARIAGVWLMGFPGVAAVERKYAEYETGARVDEGVEDAETLLNDVSSDMTEEAATFAQDLLAAAKHGTRAGGRAAKAVGAFAYNTAAFLIRSAYRAGKVVKGTLEFSAVVGVPGVAFLLAHEAAVTAWVAAQAPGMMPVLRFVLDGLRAVGL